MTHNGYISLSHALSLLNKGWMFRQDLAQTAFKICKSEAARDFYKINQKTATKIKKHLRFTRLQLILNS